MTLGLEKDRPASSRDGAPQRTTSAVESPRSAAVEAPAQTAPRLEQAAHLYSAEQAASATGGQGIRGESEARSLLQQLRARIASDPATTLAAFSKADPQRAAAALAQAPG
jgi:hypothetical protein